MPSVHIQNQARPISKDAATTFASIASIQVSTPDLDGIFALVRIVKNARGLLALKVAELGLHAGQDHLLMILLPGKPATVSHLAADLCVRPSTVSKMVDRMSAAGLVEKSENGSDARQTLIACTPAGDKIRECVRDVWMSTDAYLFQGMSPDTAEHFRDAIGQLDELLQLRVKRLR